MRKACKSGQAELRHAANDNWPLVLTRCEVAEMCAISGPTFDSWVRKGILPGPIQGTRRWSRKAIEQRLAGDVAGERASVANDQPSPLDEWMAKRARETERT